MTHPNLHGLTSDPAFERELMFADGITTYTYITMLLGFVVTIWWRHALVTEP